jgi:hypothetical protein
MRRAPAGRVSAILALGCALAACSKGASPARRDVGEDGGRDATTTTTTDARHDTITDAADAAVDLGDAVDVRHAVDVRDAADVGDATGAVDLGAATGVLTFGNHATRDGVYVDPALTRAALPLLHLDDAFVNSSYAGPLLAAPLYLDGAGGHDDLIIVATTSDRVDAFDAETGSEAWIRNLGPVGQRPSGGSCAGTTLGIEGTPVIDGARRVLYVDVPTSADGTGVNQHLVYALDADTGATRDGWPVDVGALLATSTPAFDAAAQNQRAALTLVGDTLILGYGPFGGGDECGAYRGWVVALSTTDPTHVTAWSARSLAGVWASGGASSDGASLFFATGNSGGAATWLDGHAVFKMPPTLAFSGATTDYFAEAGFAALDATDADLGATAPVVFDLPGATPSALLFIVGKEGKAHLLDRTNLGGMGAPVATDAVAGAPVTTAPVLFTTPAGTFVTYRGTRPGCGAGALATRQLVPGAPPTLGDAWCLLDQPGGPPAVSMSDGSGTDTFVWVVGADGKLYALDPVGKTVALAGTAETVDEPSKYVAPLIRRGHVFVAADDHLFAFTPN